MRKLIAVPPIKKDTCFGCLGYKTACPIDQDSRVNDAKCCDAGIRGTLTHMRIFIEASDAGRAKYIADKLTGEPNEETDR